MVVDGVEVGGDESSPTEAVVGGALLALRGDLNEFNGWHVDVHGDINATNADGEFQVTLQSGDADGARTTSPVGQAGPVSGHARAASGSSAFPRGEERAPSTSSLPVTLRRGAKRLTPFLIEINPRRLSYDSGAERRRRRRNAER